MGKRGSTYPFKVSVKLDRETNDMLNRLVVLDRFKDKSHCFRTMVRVYFGIFQDLNDAGVSEDAFVAKLKRLFT